MGGARRRGHGCPCPRCLVPPARRTGFTHANVSNCRPPGGRFRRTDGSRSLGHGPAVGHRSKDHHQADEVLVLAVRSVGSGYSQETKAVPCSDSQAAHPILRPGALVAEDVFEGDSLRGIPLNYPYCARRKYENRPLPWRRVAIPADCGFVGGQSERQWRTVAFIAWAKAARFLHVASDKRIGKQRH